jgi:murein DD-endopeptidase MepM/ murein hydrolase activator NlpD
MEMRLFTIFVFLLFSLSGKSQVSENTEFEQSKGKWPTPIANFAKYINDEERNSTSNEIGHKGITFIPNQNDSVKAVFKGRVVLIFPIANSFAVMTNYGDYFITYLNLDSPNVKKGDLIVQGKFLGHLSNSPRQLELVLTNRNDKEFDPYEWINWAATKAQ